MAHYDDVIEYAPPPPWWREHVLKRLNELEWTPHRTSTQGYVFACGYGQIGKAIRDAVECAVRLRFEWVPLVEFTCWHGELAFAVGPRSFDLLVSEETCECILADRESGATLFTEGVNPFERDHLALAVKSWLSEKDTDMEDLYVKLGGLDLEDDEEETDAAK